ncbi:MAG: PEP/pyruvate-binding domain-containing protein [Acidobacteria bacterium]|nr:PEP/pyruvate-binding domain-containing protein [Acidobacteriota bacterium]
MKAQLLLPLLLYLTFSAFAQTRGPQKAGRPLDQSPRFQHRIASQADFDKLSRTYYQGRFYALPHLMFVIDRTAKDGSGRRIYYIDSKRYSFHSEFLNANYLTLERGREFFRNNYLEAGRRFILGTIVYQTKIGKFTFEFWEGDLAISEIVREAYREISGSLFAAVCFKPNSALQEEAVARLRDVPYLLATEINPPQDYLPLNLARNVGVLRIIDRMTDDTIIDRNEIVIFREPPISLTPLSGVITTTFSTPLAHVNLLTRGWNVPNAYIKGAAELFKPLEGKFVYFETREDAYTLRLAMKEETAEYGRRMARRSDLLTPAADLRYRQLAELKDQRKHDAIRFGSKSANLGEVIYGVRRGVVRNVIVPPGFSIPFFYYCQFIEENELEDVIVEMLGNDRFNHDPVYRKQRLAALRAMIQSGILNPEFAERVVAKNHSMFSGQGVFVRSSTNSEDLPNFSGAGLYTTVPNVKSDEALLEAVKTVWASLWNYEAYEARESFGINHAAVYPAVLIQVGMNADTAGVLITTNPFDKEDRNAVYLNAKRGLGMRVVEGRRVPEQLVYNPRSRAVRVLSRSGDDTMLKFDENGGVRELKTETQLTVLTDSIVRKLARAALQIERVFGGIDQDIEWLTIGDQVYIVQSRPYIEHGQ